MRNKKVVINPMQSEKLLVWQTHQIKGGEWKQEEGVWEKGKP